MRFVHSPQSTVHSVGRGSRSMAYGWWQWWVLRCLVLVSLWTVDRGPWTISIAEAARAEIRATGTVASFGTYSFSGPLLFQITQPGDLEIGRIQVDGVYNGEYPWIMRMYTDNVGFVGIGGTLAQVSRAGLVSSDGRYVVPLFVNCPNFGEGTWVHVPDRNDPDYRPYQPSERVGAATHTECVIVGIDPRHADWVAGPDRFLWTADDNPLGDTTIATPFEIRVAARCGPEAVAGVYSGRLIIELVAAP